MIKALAEHLTVPSNCEYLEAIRGFIKDGAKKIGFDENDIWKIVLAADEACSNIIRHGYKYDPSNFIKIDIELKENRFLIHIEDDGLMYDLRFHKVPSDKEYINEPKPGGLGIKIIRHLIDEIDYNHTENKNRLSLTKFLPEHLSNS